MKTILFSALAALFSACTAWYAVSSNFNFGNLLVLALAIASGIYARFHAPIDAFTAQGFGFWLKMLFFAGWLLFFAVLAWILWGQFGNKATGKESVVLVLGCAVHGERPSMVLRYRLDEAYTYYEQNNDATFVVCGGQGAGESIPEGVAMQRYLIEKGIPEAQILCEDKSASTEENFRFALQMLQEQDASFDPEQDVAFVTNGFHCLRASLYAKREGFLNAHALPAGMPLLQRLPCYLREVFAMVYYIVFKSPNASFLHQFVGSIALFGY